MKVQFCVAKLSCSQLHIFSAKNASGHFIQDYTILLTPLKGSRPKKIDS